MNLNIMEEETLASFAIRTLLVSGAMKIESICRPLFTRNGKTECRYFPLINRELKKIFDNLISRHGCDYLLEKHSLFPIYRPIAYPHAATFLESMLTMQVSTLSNPISRICFNPKEIVCNELKYCPNCFIEQIYQFGFCWFKREWLIHTMIHCLQHKCKLLSVNCICGKKGGLMDTITSAFRGVCCHCNRDQWIIDNYYVEDNYSQWISNFLNAKLPFFSRDLQLKLLKRSVKLLLEQNADIRSEDAMWHMYQLHKPLFAKDVFNTEFLWMQQTQFHIESFLDSYFHPIRERPTQLAEIFFIISLAFPNFEEFQKYINYIGVLSERAIHLTPEHTGEINIKSQIITELTLIN